MKYIKNKFIQLEKVVQKYDYQPFQPLMDICLELCVIKDSPGEAKQDTDGLFQRLERTRLGLASGAF